MSSHNENDSVVKDEFVYKGGFYCIFSVSQISSCKYCKPAVPCNTTVYFLFNSDKQACDDLFSQLSVCW